ncbi:hypothetical protein [Patulibacter minatonensis]|uniref:hypothetical protein n=1 Tax=Patulibacter minatonensis TaxID=298163 RepID=UPI0004798851|nr:hypothetical protein [Patulibacter minatonensis]
MPCARGLRVIDRQRPRRRWRVRRRWLPWRRRVRDIPDVPIDGGDLGDDPISAIIGIFLLILAIPAIVVTLFLLAELLLLLVLLPIFVVVRLLLPVPWAIELWSRPVEQRFLGWHLEHEVPVRGWAASQARIREMAQEIQSGEGRYVPVDATNSSLPAEGAGWVPGGGAGRPAEAFGDANADRSADTATAAPPAPGRVDRTASDADATPNPFAQRDER